MNYSKNIVIFTNIMYNNIDYSSVNRYHVTELRIGPFLTVAASFFMGEKKMTWHGKEIIRYQGKEQHKKEKPTRTALSKENKLSEWVTEENRA